MKLNFRKGVEMTPGLTHNLRKTELKRLQRQFKKMSELQKAKHEVNSYENFITMICSIHKVCAEHINWKKVETTPAPFERGKQGPKETAAENSLVNFKPNIIDRLLLRVEKKQNKLAQNIRNAKIEDEKDYEAWQNKVSMAHRINQGNTSAYLDAIQQLNIFEPLSDYGKDFISYIINDTIAVKFNVQPSTFIPNQTKSLTTTGKLSIKEMGKTKFFALYQDYVCSCVIRIARDLFAILPINQVIVHAMNDDINLATGYIEQQTILSVRFNRAVLNTLNFERIDCSEAIENFEHRMKFLKTSGFKPVVQISE